MACIRIDDLPILEELGQEELQGIYGEGLFPGERLRLLAAAATLGIGLVATPFAVAGGHSKGGQAGHCGGLGHQISNYQHANHHQHHNKDHGTKHNGPVIPIDPPGVKPIPIDPPNVMPTVRDHRTGHTGSTPSGGVTVTPTDPKVKGGVTVAPTQQASQPTLPTFPPANPKKKPSPNDPSKQPKPAPPNDVIGTGPGPIDLVQDGLQAVAGAIFGGGSGPITRPGTPPPPAPTGPTIRDHR